MSELWDERNFYCDYCGAQPDETCRTATRIATGPHVSRMRKANLVWAREHPDDPRARAIDQGSPSHLEGERE